MVDQICLKCGTKFKGKPFRKYCRYCIVKVMEEKLKRIYEKKEIENAKREYY